MNDEVWFLKKDWILLNISWKTLKRCCSLWNIKSINAKW